MTVGELSVIFGLKPQGWEKGTSLVKKLSTYAKIYLGAEAIKSVVGFVEHTTEAATHLISLSTAMGMTIEQTQEWGYVAQQSGSNLKELSMGVNMLIRNLDKFGRGKGGKELAHQFTQLGLTAEDAKLAMSGSDGLQTVLLKMSDHLKNLGDKSKTAEAVMTQLFGVRAGRAMLADMARGSDAIKELMARRRDMGELTKDQAVSLRDLGNRMKDVKLSFEMLGQQVLARIAPQLLEMADAATKWIAANKDLISGAFAVALQVVTTLFSTLASVISYVADVIHAAMNGDDGAYAALVGLVAVLTGMVIPAVVMWAAATLAALAPWIGLGAIIAALIYGIIKLIDYWPEIKDAAADALNWIGQKLSDIADFVTDIPGVIGDAFKAAGNWIVTEFDKAMDAVKQAASDAWTYVRNLPVIKQALDAANYLGDKLTGNGDGGMAGDVTRVMQNQFSPSVNGPASATGTQVTVGDTNIDIHVSSTDEARKVKNDALADRDAQWRAALRGTGGSVK